LLFPFTRAIVHTAIGTKASIVPLTIAAAPFVARVIESSLKEVEPGVIQAARSMGSTDFQIIKKVLLPEARVSLVMGVAVVAVSILGYTSFAYNIGAGGLISGIYTYYTRHTGDYLGSILFWGLIVIVVLIVQGIQELGLFIAKKIDKRKILK
jgi:D-methionine transport system permease protein